MKHVFVRIEEGKDKVFSCLLLSGERAQEFLANPATFFKGLDAPKILDCWVVPEELENVNTNDPIGDAFNALLALDALSDFPAVSDLYATIFEAGFRLAASKNTA